jgi:sensor histidine kinase YesM
MGILILKKLRYGKRLNIKANIPEQHDGLLIAPLLLLPLWKTVSNMEPATI